MRTLLLFTFVCALSAQVFASKVIVLNDGNFNGTISKFELILVDFYAPWCSPCQALAPEFEAAADTLASSKPKLRLAKINCDAEKQTCNDNDILGYPTLKLFKNGKLVEMYEGDRTRDAIVQYMEKHDN